MFRLDQLCLPVYAVLALTPVIAVTDSLIPTQSDLLAGHNGLLSDAHDAPPESDHEFLAAQRSVLQRQAVRWVRQAHAPLASLKARAPTLSLACSGQPDRHGFQTATRVRTQVVAHAFFPAAHTHGVVLYEPCGGLCAGLESVLRNGIRVVRYYYSDTDPAARAVAWHRLRHLSTVYPTLLQPQAWQGVFSSLPQDITRVTAEHLVPLMQTHAEVPWLVITGWPCQDLSPAGLASGFAGRHSALFFDCVRIVGLLQQMPFKFPMGFCL